MDFTKKYLKYKSKYLNLKKQFAGAAAEKEFTSSSGLVLFNSRDGWRVVMEILNPKKTSKCIFPATGERVEKVSLPGGGKKPGENLFQAFKREYKEEIGTELPWLETTTQYYDNEFYKTRNYYSPISDNTQRIVYNIDNVLYEETIGIIFPKLKHIKEQIQKANGGIVFIQFERNTYCIRRCVVDSLQKMFNLNLLDRYL